MVLEHDSSGVHQQLKLNANNLNNIIKSPHYKGEFVIAMDEKTIEILDKFNIPYGLKEKSLLRDL